MTTVTPRVRSVARRAALLGLRTRYRVSGITRRALTQPGVTVLLLHHTPPRELKRLLHFVDDHRDQVVDFEEAMECLVSGGPKRAMLTLTFDDGFRSNREAARALGDRDVSACFYVPTDVVGRSQREVDKFFRRPQSETVMTWSDLEELLGAGHEVGSHCRQHVPLSGLDLVQAEDQVKGSVEVLRSRLGAAKHFAWPFGGVRHAPVPEVVRWCGELGVLAASGVRGRNTPALVERRGYLSREAVDLRWLRTDHEVFVARSFAQLGSAVTTPRRAVR